MGISTVQDYETGWRAISRYTGTSLAEIQSARLVGCGTYDHPRICHQRLNVWLAERLVDSLRPDTAGSAARSFLRLRLLDHVLERDDGGQ